MNQGAMPAYPVNVCGGFVAYVDAEDAPLVQSLSWAMANRGNKARPRAKFMGVKIYLHRLVMLAPVGVQVDHIDNDPLNCRKSNLRYCTGAQNAKNRLPNRGTSSKFKGVRWHAVTGKWGAAIKSDGRQEWLGVFATEQEAADAYDKAAIRLHGDFAKTNAEIFR